jgi:hypothetical protein
VRVATSARVYSVLTGKELAEEDEDVSAFEQDDEGSKLPPPPACSRTPPWHRS